MRVCTGMALLALVSSLAIFPAYSDPAHSDPAHSDQDSRWIQLTRAAADNKPLLVKKLISEGVEVSPTCSYLMMCQPLAFAAQRGHLEMIKLLVDSGAKLEGRNAYLMTALMYATRSGQIEAVKLLLEKGAKINNIDAFGRNALSISIQKENLKIAQLLLEQGANPNSLFIDQNNERKNYTILMQMARQGKVNFVKLLLKHGADRAKLDSSGKTALDYAVKHKQEEVLKVLTAKSP